VGYDNLNLLPKKAYNYKIFIKVKVYSGKWQYLVIFVADLKFNIT